VKARDHAVNAGISVMLLGSIGFMMSLFYLTNLKDPQLRKYSWLVISNTISIFCAVLFFQALNGFVDDLLKDSSESLELEVDFVHFLVWFITLQCILALSAGAVALKLDATEEEEAFHEEGEKHRKVKLHSNAILLGHLAGFAAINAFGVLQQQVWRNSLCIFLVFPVTWAVIHFCGKVTQWIRYELSKADSDVSEAEIEWDEVTTETEDDIIGLAASFMLCQFFRYLWSGILPNEEGIEDHEVLRSHKTYQVLLLLLSGCLVICLEMFRILFHSHKFQGFQAQFQNVSAMCFAWCLFYSSDWFVSRNFFPTKHGMMKEICLSLFVTIVALALIFILDVIADWDATGKEIDNAVRGVIKAIAVLIGFSWEKGFDVAVDGLAQDDYKSVTKMILAVVLGVMVLPAWRWYILPLLLEYEEAEKEAEELENMEARAHGEKFKRRGLQSFKKFEEKGEALEEPLLAAEESGERRKFKPKVERKDSLIGMGHKELRIKCFQSKRRCRELEEEKQNWEAREQRTDNNYSDSAAEDSAAAIQRLENEKEELEKKNRMLETSMDGLHAELGELQKLAELLG